MSYNNDDEESNFEGSMKDVALGASIEEFTDEDTRDLSNNNVGLCSDTDDDSRSVVSIKLYRRPSLVAAEETSSVQTEDKGWEDCDNDHRRALGKSHTRTLNTLEEASIRGARSKVTHEEPIMPSISEFSSAETDSKYRAESYKNKNNAKKRKGGQSNTTKKSSSSLSSWSKQQQSNNNPNNNKKTFFNKHCIVLTSTVVLCFVALMALQHFVVLPPGTLAGTNVLRQNNVVDENNGTTVVVDTEDATTLIVVPEKSFIPLINRNTEVMNVEEEEEMEAGNKVFGFLRHIAFSIGNYFYPMPTLPSNHIKTAITADDLELLKTIELPIYDNLYSNVNEATVHDIQPVLWDTKRSGSGALKTILTYCYKLVLTSDMAIGHEEAQALEIYSTGENVGHYANVNTETLEGLKRAQDVGVIDSNLVNVISTPYIGDASSLFIDKTRTGRIFAMLRHPVEQAHSDFLYRKTLPDNHPDRIPHELSLLQYAESNYLQPNALTKTLLNIKNNDTIALTELHILGAQKLLQDYVYVGLLDSFDESIRMFATYFGWGDTTTPSNIHSLLIDPVCITNFETTYDNRKTHEQISDDSGDEWKTIADRNYADIQLYIFAQSLYDKQKKELLIGSN